MLNDFPPPPHLSIGQTHTIRNMQCKPQLISLRHKHIIKCCQQQACFTTLHLHRASIIVKLLQSQQLKRYCHSRGQLHIKPKNGNTLIQHIAEAASAAAITPAYALGGVLLFDSIMTPTMMAPSVTQPATSHQNSFGSAPFLPEGPPLTTPAACAWQKKHRKGTHKAKQHRGKI